MAFFSTQVDAILNNWLDRSYDDLVYRKHPLYGAATKESEYGNAVKVPVSYAYTGGEGADFTTAKNNQTDVQRAAFVVTPGLHYVLENFSYVDALYSEDKDTAAVNVMTDVMEKTLRAAGDAAERALFGDGSGTMAKIKSNTGGGPYVLTLTMATDAWKFNVNQVLVSKATPFAASLDTGSAKVTGVDVAAGTVTVAAASGWTPTNAHYIGLQGVMLASATPGTFIGLPGWNPDVNNRPAANDSFFGVNRSANAVALAGHALDGSGLPIPQAINQLAQAMSNVNGINIDSCFMNPSTFGKLQDILGDRRRYTDVRADGASFLYKALEFETATGAINIIPSTYCPADHIYVGDSSKLILGAPGQFIQNAAKDGKYVELQDSDGGQVRYRLSGFVYIKNPAAWGNILVSA